MQKKTGILLAEDEVIAAMLIEKQLKDIGYTVSHHVTTGEKAISSAKDNHPDITIMDIRLAGEIDGIEAAAAIKSENDIPVIFITGYDDLQARERAEKIKPLAFLIKPIEVIKLKTILDNYFK